MTESDFTPDNARTIATRILKAAQFADGDDLPAGDPDVKELSL